MKKIGRHLSIGGEIRKAVSLGDTDSALFLVAELSVPSLLQANPGESFQTVRRVFQSAVSSKNHAVASAIWKCAADIDRHCSGQPVKWVSKISSAPLATRIGFGLHDQSPADIPVHPFFSKTVQGLCPGNVDWTRVSFHPEWACGWLTPERSPAFFHEMSQGLPHWAVCEWRDCLLLFLDDLKGKPTVQPLPFGMISMNIEAKQSLAMALLGATETNLLESATAGASSVARARPSI